MSTLHTVFVWLHDKYRCRNSVNHIFLYVLCLPNVAYTVKYALGAIFLSNISVSYHICTCMLHVCTVSLSLYCTAGYRIILYVLCSPNVICFSHKTERRQLERKEGGTRFMLHLLYTLPFLSRAEGSFCAVNNHLGKPSWLCTRN